MWRSDIYNRYVHLLSVTGIKELSCLYSSVLPRMSSVRKRTANAVGSDFE